jgi:hypothetical protein
VTSRRNLDLLNPIATTFVKAVLQFCKHPDLRYTWPQFLPSLDEATGFWSGLNQMIRRYVSETPVLRSRHSARLRRLDDVFVLTNDFMDKSSHPLIDENKLDPYLSDKYPSSCSAILRRYGLKYNNFDVVLKLLQCDLDSPDSRVKSLKSEEWHSKLAQILLKLTPSRLQHLELLPLRNGKWVSSNSCSALLPTTNAIPIPKGLPMPILDPLATKNADRLALYIRLGALEPSISDVRDCILGHYGLFTKKTDFETSRSHLHFLYTSHQPKERNEWQSYRSKFIQVYDNKGSFINPYFTDCYLRSEQTYGPQKLLGPTNSSPGLDARFLHSFYHEIVPEAPNKTHPTWNCWLHEVLGVKTRLSLVSQEGDKLSRTWTFIAENRPEKLLGLLRHLWGYEGSILSKQSKIIDAIRNTSAKDLCNPRLLSSCNLHQTYLPFETLRQECRRFLDESDEFPFLELEGFSSSLESGTGWMFLNSVFLVGKETNLAFYLDVLSRLKSSDHQAVPLSKDQRVLDLYATMGPYVSRSSGGGEVVR